MQTTISLVWGFFTFEQTVQDTDNLLRAEYSKDQPEHLHTCRGIRMYNTFCNS